MLAEAPRVEPKMLEHGRSMLMLVLILSLAWGWRTVMFRRGSR